MRYDVWARFEDPANFEGDYVRTIEKALRASGRERITLEDVQRRFKDYKNSECAREQVRYNRSHRGLCGNHIPDERTLEEYFESSSFTAGLDAEALIEFELFFHDKNNGVEIDGSGNKYDGKSGVGTIPKETAMLYGKLWPAFFECVSVDANRPEWDRWHHGPLASSEFFGIRAGGDILNSFYKGVFNSVRKQDSEDSSILIPLAMFAYLTHTAGNLIPMPLKAYPEGTRQTANTTHGKYPNDRWDLFMEDIRVWYEYRKETNLEKKPYKYPYLGKVDHPDSATYKWLDSFECFGDFVDRNHLEDYTKESDNVKVVAFYKAFSEEDGEAALFDRLIEMNARIIARGIRMRQKAAEMPDVSADNLKFIFGW